MRLSRRHFLRQFAGATALTGFAAFPLSLRFSEGMVILATNAAHAQGNGNGNGGGNGGGNGNGNGGGGGNGNGGGGNGAGNGNAGGGGQGNNNGNAAGHGKGQGAAKSSSQSASTSPAETLNDVSVVHRNGMSETVQDGRYVMRDAEGRTIVNRKATIVDYRRLRFSR